MDQIDIAWVAGILEGEGTFHVLGGKYPEAKVLMTDKDVVWRLHEVTGLGNVAGPIQHKAGGKPLYQWKVSDKRGVARLLLAVYPLMGQRRQQKIGELAEILPTVRGRDEPLCRKCGANDWYHRPVGGRQCRPCYTRMSRERRQKVKVT